jgi:hypothetical protein
MSLMYLSSVSILRKTHLAAVALGITALVGGDVALAAVQNPVAEQIASELRLGYETGGPEGSNKALFARMASKIKLWHLPPDPKMDILWDRDAIIRIRTAEVAAFGKAMPDYKETGKIWVDGNEIIHDMVITGTFESKPVLLILPCKWIVQGNQIVGMGSYVTTDFPMTLKLLKAGGFTGPREVAESKRQ